MCHKIIPANLTICTLENSLVKISSVSPEFYVVWLYAYSYTYFVIQKLHFSLCFSKQNRSLYCVNFTNVSNRQLRQRCFVYDPW